MEDLETRKHPSTEELFLRQAVVCLTKRQLIIWEFVNYERYTQAEIGKMLGISQPAVNSHMRESERKITKWIKEHRAMYDRIKDFQDGV